MPGAGARLNFAERCLARATTVRPALISVPEGGAPVEMSWEQLGRRVAAVAASLREMGVEPGDRIAGYLPNTADAVVALLAGAAVGAVWTVCSPDFGTGSVLARLRQARPTVLVAADGYHYGGRSSTGARRSPRSWTGCPRSGTCSRSITSTRPRPDRRGRGGRPWSSTHGPTWWNGRRNSASPTSRSTTHCGFCGRPAPRACRRASCSPTAASSWSCSRPSDSVSTCGATIASSSTPPPAGWCGTSWSAVCCTVPRSSCTTAAPPVPTRTASGGSPSRPVRRWSA